MSVLFKALQKNARVREQDGARGYVPLMPLQTAPASGFSWKGFCIICITLGFGVLGYVVHDISGTPVLAAISPAQASPQTAALPAATPHPKQSTLPRHGRKVEDEPQGIALTLDSLSGTREAGEDTDKTPRRDVDEVAARLPTKVSARKTAPPEIGVDRADEIAEEGSVTSSSARSSLRVKVQAEPAQPPKADDLSRQARQALDRRAFAEAEDLYARLLAQTPSRKDALEGRVYALSQIANADASARLSQLAETYPKAAVIQAALAEVKMKQGASKTAIAHWWSAIALEPDNDKYRLALAVLLDRQDETEAALNLYRQIKEPRPESVKRRLAYLAAQEGASSADPSDDTDPSR